MRYDPDQHPFGMMRLSFSSPEERADYEENKAHYNRQIRGINSAASQKAKQETCALCGKPCSSFCNSHSIPQFALRRIAENGKVDAAPCLSANCADAELIHEAAIGKIAGEQITKLCSMGLTQSEAEQKIIEGFLK